MKKLHFNQITKMHIKQKNKQDATPKPSQSQTMQGLYAHVFMQAQLHVFMQANMPHTFTHTHTHNIIHDGGICVLCAFLMGMVTQNNKNINMHTNIYANQIQRSKT